jgi:hypothetical protein
MRPRIGMTERQVQPPERDHKWAAGVLLRWLWLTEPERDFILTFKRQREPRPGQYEQLCHIIHRASRRMLREGCV